MGLFWICHHMMLFSFGNNDDDFGTSFLIFIRIIPFAKRFSCSAENVLALKFPISVEQVNEVNIWHWFIEIRVRFRPTNEWMNEYLQLHSFLFHLLNCCIYNEYHRLFTNSYQFTAAKINHCRFILFWSVTKMPSQIEWNKENMCGLMLNAKQMFEFNAKQMLACSFIRCVSLILNEFGFNSISLVNAM